MLEVGAAKGPLLDALHECPNDRAVLWTLGLDRQFADEPSRRTELPNILDHVAPL